MRDTGSWRRIELPGFSGLTITSEPTVIGMLIEPSLIGSNTAVGSDATRPETAASSASAIATAVG